MSKGALYSVHSHCSSRRLLTLFPGRTDDVWSPGSLDSGWHTGHTGRYTGTYWHTGHTGRSGIFIEKNHKRQTIQTASCSVILAGSGHSSYRIMFHKGDYLKNFLPSWPYMLKCLVLSAGVTACSLAANWKKKENKSSIWYFCLSS